MDHDPGDEHEEDGWRDRARRLRWRLSGAWQLPTFAVTTVLGTLVVHWRPFAGTRTDVASAFLLAGFANLVLLAAVAPAAGWLLRRRRPGLPRAIATDHAGATLLAAMLGLFVVLGLAHHGAVVDARHADDRELAAARAYLVQHGTDQYVRHAARPSVWKQADFLYRTCFAGDDPRRNFCLFVDLSHDPPRVTRDPDQQPNSFVAGTDNPGRQGH
ncbi:hypothetical protein NBH00_00880 [Paraconexibacter antarcticus]|uniref:Uncharacterized protein n=1 Tax=Paraconexibacter antarcticus TaxID=2949664 RepID=A0ABY5DUL5_9ACTN|nr:hypothetical protein [Paraconexibacter antarcticus]UTI64777.1 hypothetical protein NBH00_00880 [Paraconexibacter antarcticus]